jgi:hypothetical protein
VNACRVFVKRVPRMERHFLSPFICITIEPSRT